MSTLVIILDTFLIDSLTNMVKHTLNYSLNVYVGSGLGKMRQQSNVCFGPVCLVQLKENLGRQGSISALVTTDHVLSILIKPIPIPQNIHTFLFMDMIIELLQKSQNSAELRQSDSE